MPSGPGVDSGSRPSPGRGPDPGWRGRASLLSSPATGSEANLQLATILLLAAAEPGPVEIAASDFELKPPAPAPTATPQDCRRSAGVGEIVVCGRRQDDYRAREIRPPRGIKVDEGGVVGLNLGGTRIEPALSQVGMPDGRVSKRIMVTVKAPF